MRYLQQLDIKEFRGIKNLQLNDFGDVSVIVGENNIGKTTILEAISLFEC